MRLIDADALKKDLKDNYVYCGFSDLLNDFYSAIDEQPSADVPDRKVGKWVWMVDKCDPRFMCSVCKGKEDVPTIMGKPIVWDYCPSCGARMKGEDDG